MKSQPYKVVPLDEQVERCDRAIESLLSQVATWRSTRRMLLAKMRALKARSLSQGR